MEDEIDLRKYFGVVTRQWKWVVGLTVIAGVAAFGVSLLLPPTYEATALVVIAQERYQLQFDPRIATVSQQQQPYRAFPELALSDDLMRQVAETANGASSANEGDLTELRGRLSAKAGADLSLLRLAATSMDPLEAQTLANTWATLYVPYVNDLYQPRTSDVTFFESQVAEANTNLRQAEQALVDFQARNPILVVTAQLSSTQATLMSYLEANQNISRLIQDAHSLKQQLARQETDGHIGLADDLATLYLQVDALHAQPNVPIQLQVTGGTLSGRTVPEQQAVLDGLVEALEDQSGEIQQEIESLRPEILGLQNELQAAQVELNQLSRSRGEAENTYLTLTRKLDEARVSAQRTSGAVRLASQAAVPTELSYPRKGLNTVLGAMAGLLIGIVAAFVIDARRSSTGHSAQS